MGLDTGAASAELATLPNLGATCRARHGYRLLRAKIAAFHCVLPPLAAHLSRFVTGICRYAFYAFNQGAVSL